MREPDGMNDVMGRDETYENKPVWTGSPIFNLREV